MIADKEENNTIKGEKRYKSVGNFTVMISTVVVGLQSDDGGNLRLLYSSTRST